MWLRASALARHTSSSRPLGRRAMVPKACVSLRWCVRNGCALLRPLPVTFCPVDDISGGWETLVLMDRASCGLGLLILRCRHRRLPLVHLGERLVGGAIEDFAVG